MTSKTKTAEKPHKPHGEARTAGASTGVIENPFSGLQRTVGNQAMLRLFQSGGIQAKLRVSHPGDADEQEADRAAEQIVSRKSYGGGPVLQRKCACGGTCSSCKSEQDEDQIIHRSAVGPLRAFPFAIQRAADEEPSHQAAAAREGARHDQAKHPGERPHAVVVEDNAPSLQPGQMRKTEFLNLVQSSACATADAVLESVQHTTKGCPYIKKWLAHYQETDAAHLTRAMHKYAPETAKARSANEAIALVNQRVRRAALSWAKTGKVSDLPEGMQEEMSGTQPGKTTSTGRIQRKSRDGALASAQDAATVREEMGSGHALDGRVQSQMSAAFGYDFSGVRVHTDAKAGELSGQLNARAFTIGNDVAFAGGEYKPGTLVGDALIAHELAHVVQQGGGKQTSTAQSKDADFNNESSLEQDADRSAVGAAVSGWIGIKKGMAKVGTQLLPRLKSGLRLQRCGKTVKKCPPGRTWQVVGEPAGMGSLGCLCHWKCLPGVEPASEEYSSGPSISCDPQRGYCPPPPTVEVVGDDYQKVEEGETGYGAQFHLGDPLATPAVCGCLPMDIEGNKQTGSPMRAAGFDPTNFYAGPLPGSKSTSTQTNEPTRPAIVEPLKPPGGAPAAAPAEGVAGVGGPKPLTPSPGVRITPPVVPPAAGIPQRPAAEGPTAAQKTTTTGTAGAAPPPNKFANTSTEELRTLAKSDSEAAHELISRYKQLPTKELQKLETKGDATAKAVLDQGYREPNVVPAQPTRAVQQVLTQDLATYRKELSVAKTPISGGTAGVARTDLPKLAGRLFKDASPMAGVEPETAVEKTIKTPFKHGAAQNHAEEGLANQLDGAIVEAKLTPDQMEGSTVWIRVEQEVCPACKSGLADPAKAAGVLKQISLKYPGVTFEVTAEGTSEVVRIRNGQRIQ